MSKETRTLHEECQYAKSMLVGVSEYLPQIPKHVFNRTDYAVQLYVMEDDTMIMQYERVLQVVGQINIEYELQKVPNFIKEEDEDA